MCKNAATASLAWNSLGVVCKNVTGATLIWNSLDGRVQQTQTKTILVLNSLVVVCKTAPLMVIPGLDHVETTLNHPSYMIVTGIQWIFYCRTMD